MQTVNISLSNGQQRALAKILKAKGYSDPSVNKQLQAYIEDLIDSNDPIGGATSATTYKSTTVPAFKSVCPIEGCGNDETTNKSEFGD
jgi:hypothetical protein